MCTETHADKRFGNTAFTVASSQHLWVTGDIFDSIKMRIVSLYVFQGADGQRYDDIVLIWIAVLIGAEMQVVMYCN